MNKDQFTKWWYAYVYLSSYLDSETWQHYHITLCDMAWKNYKDGYLSALGEMKSKIDDLKDEKGLLLW